MILNTFLDLCSGIGGGRLGLEENRLKCIGYSDRRQGGLTNVNMGSF